MERDEIAWSVASFVTSQQRLEKYVTTNIIDAQPEGVMAKQVESFIESEKADNFAATLEEATRSTDEGVKYFIEPAKGTLSRGKTRRHHFIFGRRGSGKSSLLNKLKSEFTLERTPVAYVDLETFKGHSYPDVLISILIKTLESYEDWLSTAGVFPASKQSFWQKLFGAKPREKSLDKGRVGDLLKRIGTMKAELNVLLLEPEESSRVRTASQEKQATIGGNASTSIGRFKLGVDGNRTNNAGKKIQDTYTSKKMETLHRRILDFKSLFGDIALISERACYLLVDDLYHIKSGSQAHVVDYFHRITKGQIHG